MVRQWLPSLTPDHASTPNPRALLPGMGEPDSPIPQPVPPELPESQRRRYEAAALLTAASTAKGGRKSVATSAPTASNSSPHPQSSLRLTQGGGDGRGDEGQDDFEDTYSDSV